MSANESHPVDLPPVPEPGNPDELSLLRAVAVAATQYKADSSVARQALQDQLDAQVSVRETLQAELEAQAAARRDLQAQLDESNTRLLAAAAGNGERGALEERSATLEDERRRFREGLMANLTRATNASRSQSVPRSGGNHGGNPAGANPGSLPNPAEDPGNNENSDPLPYYLDRFAKSLGKALSESRGSASSFREQNPVNLTETTAEAWQVFKENFLETAHLNGWDESRAKSKLKTSMREQAAILTRHITFGFEDTLEDCLDFFEQVFVHSSGTDLAKVEYNIAKRRPDEMLHAFHNRLRILFMRSYPERDPEWDEDLRYQFPLRLNSEKITKEMRLKDNLKQFSYSELLEVAQNVLAAFTLVKQTYSPTGAGRISTLDCLQDEQGLNALNNECWICKKIGHFASECQFFQDSLKRIKKNPKQWGLAPGPTPTTTSHSSASRGNPGRGRGRSRGQGRNRGQNRGNIHQVGETGTQEGESSKEHSGN